MFVSAPVDIFEPSQEESFQGLRVAGAGGIKQLKESAAHGTNSKIPSQHLPYLSPTGIRPTVPGPYVESRSSLWAEDSGCICLYQAS